MNINEYTFIFREIHSENPECFLVSKMSVAISGGPGDGQKEVDPR